MAHRGRRFPRGRAAADEAREAWLTELYATRDRIAPLLPDLDPGDLLLILRSLLPPPGGERRFFLTELRPGVYVR